MSLKKENLYLDFTLWYKLIISDHSLNQAFWEGDEIDTKRKECQEEISSAYLSDLAGILFPKAPGAFLQRIPTSQILRY